MQITDLEGRVIAVTDLEAAIAQVEEFMRYHHIDSNEGLQRLEAQRLRYWQDIYNKLLELRKTNTI